MQHVNYNGNTPRGPLLHRAEDTALGARLSEKDECRRARRVLHGGIAPFGSTLDSFLVFLCAFHPIKDLGAGERLAPP